MAENLLEVHELARIKALPQYNVEPIVYYVTRFGPTLNPPKIYRYKVEAYLLCKHGSCVGLHFTSRGELFFNGDVEKLPEIIDGLLETGELGLHEIHALAKFFMVDVETIEEILYENRIRSLLRSKRIAIVRGIAYLLDNNRIVPVGELSEEEVRRYGGKLVPDPVYNISNVIRKAIAPTFYLRGHGEVLYCNNRRRRCVCFQVEDIVDLIAKQLGITEKKAERWIKSSGTYIVWVEGWKYESECPPKRVREAGGEEKTESRAIEYITR